MYFCNTSKINALKFCPIMKKTLHTSFGIKLTSLVTVMLFLFTFQTKTNAQAVDYAIKWKHGYDLGDTLTVYMRSATTINFPFNQVSTAQVTLRVPQNMLPFFDGSDKSTVTIPDTLIGHNNGLWSNNARFNVGQTTNNTDQYILGTLQDHQDGNFYDYISFGLTSLGTRNIEFVAGEELPLFSFIFPYTTLCVDSIPIQILDHVLDSSFLENGVTSPNNNISVLGAGGDIYSGNYFTEYGARCYDYDNDDVYNPDDACDYTTLEHIEDGIVDSLGCTDLDGDGFYIDDNPTAEDQDSRTSTRPDTLGDAPIETYNEYDTDITSKCVPQGDSIIADLYVYTAAGAEFTNGSTTICAGDQIELRISINETESTGDANESSNPYDYDHRGGYTVTVNSDLSGDFTVPISGTDTVILLTPTEDGATYSLVQVLDTFLCSAIEMNNEGQIFLNEGVTLATIDGDAALCGTEDSVDIEIDLVQGTAPFTVTYGAEGADTTTITMTDRNEIITVAVNSSRTYRLISVVDNGGCPTPAGALIGSAIIEFTDLAALDVADVTMTLPSDCGAEDGTITVDSTGFGSGTEFSINGGVTWSTDPSFTGLGAGTN